MSRNLNTYNTPNVILLLSEKEIIVLKNLYSSLEDDFIILVNIILDTNNNHIIE